MISTHILDTSLGNPAADVPILLSKYENNQWNDIGSGTTNKDGRLTFDIPQASGTYRLKFKIEAYFKSHNVTPFFVVAPVIFNITDISRKYHIPLLLNPYGYSTYRGS